jgi:UDP:flavonoid glycosyltransferase YjiC (YdhE family)
MRILFCALGGPGFVYPAVGIALALKRRGHEVAFVTSQSFHEPLRAVGLDRIPRGDKDGDSFQVHLWFRELAVAIQVKHVERALDAFRPDILVGHQLALGPFLAAERRQLPIVALGLAAYLFPAPGAHTPPTIPAEKYEWRHRDMLGHFNRARSLLNLPLWPEDAPRNPLLGDALLLQSVPALEPRRHAFPSAVRFVGACLWEPPGAPDPELSLWMKDAAKRNRPIIYVQPGRSFEHEGFWPHLVAALADLDVGVVADTARMDKPAERASERFFTRPHIPHSQVLPYAGGVVSGGHTTSVLGAAMHGLPSLLIPSGSGTEEISENFRAAGAAVVVHCQTTNAAGLRESVARLLADDALRRGARAVQERFRRVNGCERSADIIEGLGRRAEAAACSHSVTARSDRALFTTASSGRD